MWSSCLLSAVTTPLRIEPHRGQVAEDFLERLAVVDGEESGDVLKEYDGGRTIVDRTTYLGPEPSLISRSQTLAGHARALAREACNEEIHESTESSAVEGGEVRPDRSRIQLPFFHARDQNSGGCDFALHVADRASASDRPVDSHVESSVSRTERDDVDVGIDGSRLGTWSHIGGCYLRAPVFSSMPFSNPGRGGVRFFGSKPQPSSVFRRKARATSGFIATGTSTFGESA